MYCQHCGSEIRRGEKFCSNCGAPVAAQQAGAPWLSGARAGVLDAYALCCVRWGELIGLAAADRPHLLAQLRKLADEPAFARAIAREGLPLP